MSTKTIAKEKTPAHQPITQQLIAESATPSAQHPVIVLQEPPEHTDTELVECDEIEICLAYQSQYYQVHPDSFYHWAVVQGYTSATGHDGFSQYHSPEDSYSTQLGMFEFLQEEACANMVLEYIQEMDVPVFRRG